MTTFTPAQIEEIETTADDASPRNEAYTGCYFGTNCLFTL
jgi:hypothetical protein